MGDLYMDPHEYWKSLVGPAPKCRAKIEYRGKRWTCLRPSGHEGEHARVEMNIHYFDDEKPTSSAKFDSRLDVELPSDLHARVRIPQADLEYALADEHDEDPRIVGYPARGENPDA